MNKKEELANILVFKERPLVYRNSLQQIFSLQLKLDLSSNWKLDEKVGHDEGISMSFYTLQHSIGPFSMTSTSKTTVLDDTLSAV